MTDTFLGLLIPFLGTSLGAACVFFMQGKMNRGVERGLTGFASGVMVAASIWSLLIPALDGPLGVSAACHRLWDRDGVFAAA